jgi:2-dehydro-3-deoxyphosphogluconate aldolase/(4S)-4-hydroxy-2-oxoglutarate aldolase
MPIADLCRLAPVIPVIVIDRLEDSVPLARALVEGGLPVLEVTMRTPAALEAVAAIRRDVSGAHVGVGTVLTANDLDRALAAGAMFAVSPGATAALLKAASHRRVPFLPGAATASEVMSLREAGFSHLKFFPAEQAGGVPALKALSGPLSDVRFCPTGGVGASNAAAYLALSNVMCVGGSWVAPADAILRSDFDAIRALARAAAALPRPS